MMFLVFVDALFLLGLLLVQFGPSLMSFRPFRTRRSLVGFVSCPHPTTVMRMTRKTLAPCTLFLLPRNPRARSPQLILSPHSDLQFRSWALSTLPRPQHPKARSPNTFLLVPIFFKEIASYEARLSRQGSHPCSPVRPSGGTRPHPYPSPLPVARPTTSRPRPVGALWLRPSRHPVPLSPPQPARTVTSPSTAPSSPLPVQALSHYPLLPLIPTFPPPPGPFPTSLPLPLRPRPLPRFPPKARPSSSLRRPSTSLLSPQSRPAPVMPLSHTSVTPSGPPSLPRKTPSRPRPSTSPFSISPSYFDPLAHSPPRPEAHSSTPLPRPFPPPTADPVPPSNPLPESSPRRRKHRHRGLVGTATPRIDHGTVRGSWSHSQLVNALSSLCDTPSQLKFTRLAGCGAHSQLRFPWKGNTVLVNTWHTGRVHLQGYGASDLARHLSGMSSSFSRVRTRSSSPGSTGDSSGVGNNPFWVGLNLCLTLFMWILHLGIFCWAQAFRGASVVSFSLPKTYVPTEENQRIRVASGVAQRSSSKDCCPCSEGAGPSTQCHPLHSSGLFKSVYPHGPLVAGPLTF